MILLSRSYAGYPAGVIVELATSVEQALVAQGYGTVSAGPVTAGATTTTNYQGSCAVAAAASSVVITHPYVDISTKIFAVIAQTTADTTALYVARIVPAAGSFTIFVNAAATAATIVDWSIVDPLGMSPSN